MPSPAVARTMTRRVAVRLGGGGLAAALAMRRTRSSGAQELTTLESNKALVHRLFEAVNDRNEAVIANLYDPDIADRGAWIRQMPGPAGMPLPMVEFHAVFPDVSVMVESTIAEEDLVATRVAWRAIHPPTVMHVVGRTMHNFRISNGLIIEQWSVGWDWIDKLHGRPAPRPRNPLATDGFR